MLPQSYMSIKNSNKINLYESVFRVRKLKNYEFHLKSKVYHHEKLCFGGLKEYIILTSLRSYISSQNFFFISSRKNVDKINFVYRVPNEEILVYYEINRNSQVYIHALHFVYNTAPSEEILKLRIRLKLKGLLT